MCIGHFNPADFLRKCGAASKQSVLIKGSNCPRNGSNNVSIIVFDKTGTLTKGIFKLIFCLQMDFQRTGSGCVEQRLF